MLSGSPLRSQRRNRHRFSGMRLPFVEVQTRVAQNIQAHIAGFGVLFTNWRTAIFAGLWGWPSANVAVAVVYATSCLRHYVPTIASASDAIEHECQPGAGS